MATRRRHRLLNDSALFPADPLCGRGKGRQARLHGKGVLHRCARLSQSDGIEQAGRRKGIEGGRRLQRRCSKLFQTNVKKIQDGAIGEVDLSADVLQRRFSRRRTPSARNALGNGISTPQLEFLPLAVGRQYRRFFRTPDRHLQLDQERSSDPGQRHGRPAERVNAQVYDHHFVEFVYKDGSRAYCQSPANERLL